MKKCSTSLITSFLAWFGLILPLGAVEQPAIPPVGGTAFAEISTVAGINFEYLASHTAKKYLLETMGAGVALFDYDNDGRLDIFLANGARIDDPTPKGTVPRKDGPKSVSYT